MTSGKTSAKPAKKRLDVLLVERGQAESRHKAQAVILAGQVRVDGQPVTKAGASISAEAKTEIVGDSLRYASRAGLKLEGALADFAVSATGKICLDAGSSTGGFTDCLLQHGAAKVYAVDVTTSQLAWKLQSDPRVHCIRINVRYLQAKELDQPPAIVTADLSFISIAKVLPSLAAVSAPGADFLILVKPQFELERGDVGRGGIVREPELHERAVGRVRDAAVAAGLELVGVRPSCLPGAEGNQEFFLHARLPLRANTPAAGQSLR